MKRLLTTLILIAALGASNWGCTGNGARDIAMLAIAGKFQGDGEIRTSGKPFGVGMDTNWYFGADTSAVLTPSFRQYKRDSDSRLHHKSFEISSLETNSVCMARSTRP